MKLPRHRTTDSTGTEVSFPKLESWNPVTKVASITAEVRKERVLCRISLKLLQDRFGASPEEPMQAVADNRAIIRAAAQKVIESEAYEEDGSVVIRAKDI